MAGQLKHKIRSLRSVIIITVFVTVALSLLLVATLFYQRSEASFTQLYRKNIEAQLKQINSNAQDQIKIVDSFFSLLMTNTIIRENLDPASQNYNTRTPMDRKLNIERQMTYMLVSTYLWDEEYINGVYVFDESEMFKVSLHKNTAQSLKDATVAYEHTSRQKGTLEIKTYDNVPGSIYFSRNIYSTYTGNLIATIMLEISASKWMEAYTGETSDEWLVLLYNDDMKIMDKSKTGAPMQNMDDIIAATRDNDRFREEQFGGLEYFVVSQKIENTSLKSVVAAPKALLLSELTKVLDTFVLLYGLVILAVLAMALLISYRVTHPLKKMINYVRGVSKGRTTMERPKGIYTELDEFATVFDDMLKRIEAYYSEVLDKQLLLKNAEIKALQAQMDPHFLFNTLNTVAWKARMSGDDEVYTMILSIGELLRANVMSKDKAFVSLDEEMNYVKLYIYLQKIRFEDKFESFIYIDKDLSELQVPRFSIQPLVENAILHGLEPLTRSGKLIICVQREANDVRITVLDSGGGFPPEFLIDDVPISDESAHLHIGLKNLNRRLILLYGDESSLHLGRNEEGMTTISFLIPDNEFGG